MKASVDIESSLYFGGWPHLNSEKRLFVAGAAPYGSQGAGVDFLSAWSARHPAA